MKTRVHIFFYAGEQGEIFLPVISLRCAKTSIFWMTTLRRQPVNPSSKWPLVISRIFPWPFEPPEKHENILHKYINWWKILYTHSMARANLKKSKHFSTSTTTASKRIPKRPRICINWNLPFQTQIYLYTSKCEHCETRFS